MKRFHLLLGAWIAGGLDAAAMVVPGISYTASTLTQIVGTNGTTVANVTPSGQLQSAEAAPGSFFSHYGQIFNATNRKCDVIYTPPANKGLVIRDLRWNTLSGAAVDQIAVVPAADCNGPSIGNNEQEINPGFSVPANTPSGVVYEDTDGALSMIFQIDGYFVPKGNVLTQN